MNWPMKLLKRLNRCFKKTIRNAEQLTLKLESTRQNADSLLLSATGNVNLVTTRTTRLLDSIDLNPTLTRVNSTLDHLDKKLPSLLEKADATLYNINRISYETRLLSENTFPRIPGVISQAEDVMLSTDRLINSLQNTWLLRDTSSTAGKQGFITGDSHE
jgi:phospholipid/cholesterol/gamma-HCH transport system substrate-binding protein